MNAVDFSNFISNRKFPCKFLSKKHFLNASELYSFCMREKCFIKSLSKDNIPSGEISQFSEFCRQFGTFYHSYLQGIFGDLKILKGNWKCSKCDNIYNFSYKPEKCKCGSNNFSYQELSFFDKKYRVSGFIDGLVCKNRLEMTINNEDWIDELNPDNLSLIEIKTVDSITFENTKDINFVLSNLSWMWQANWYMFQLNKNDIEVNSCYFMFLNRDTYDLNFVEVEYDLSIVKDIIQKIEVFWNYYDGNVIPPLCEKQFCYKNCYFRNKCH